MDLQHGAKKFLQISIYPLLWDAGLHSTCSFWLVVKVPGGGYNQL